MAVVRTVSAIEGKEPCSLRPFSDVLDPDALDSLFNARPNGDPRTGGCLSFVYSNCYITIQNGEYISAHLLDIPNDALGRVEPDRREFAAQEMRRID